MRVIFCTALLLMNLPAQGHHISNLYQSPTIIIQNTTIQSPYTHCHRCMPTSCGVVRPDEFQGRLYGAVRSLRGRYPWTVMILDNSTLVGGGALISCNLVVTSAYNIDQVSNLTNLRVRLGAVDGSGSEDIEVEMKVVKVTTNNQWNPRASLFGGDIALLQLEKSIDFQEFNGYIYPVCLPKSDRVYSGWLTVTGYGQNVDGTNNDELRETDVRIQNSTECSMFLTTPSTLCALGRDRGLCAGDRGDPAVQSDANGQFSLAAIANDYQCMEGTSDVYTSIPDYVPWICSVQVED